MEETLRHLRPHSALGYRSPAPASVLVQSSQIQQISLALRLVQILGADHFSDKEMTNNTISIEFSSEP